MAVIILSSNTRVSWLTACANVQSPTTAELNAGTAMETLIRTDGLKVNPASDKIDVSNLSTKYKLERFSLVGYDVALTFHHDTVADTAWTTFPFKTAGFLAIRRGLARATAWATGQGAGAATGTLLILPLECGMADEVDPPANWDFEVPYALTADPGDRAVVA